MSFGKDFLLCIINVRCENQKCNYFVINRSIGSNYLDRTKVLDLMILSINYY